MDFSEINQFLDVIELTGQSYNDYEAHLLLQIVLAFAFSNSVCDTFVIQVRLNLDAHLLLKIVFVLNHVVQNFACRDRWTSSRQVSSSP
jgi:hypothetical protein